MFDNLRLGIDSLQSDAKVLIVTSDIPLIAPEAIQDFIRRCDAVEADVYYPITTKEVNERKYPGVHRIRNAAEGILPAATWCCCRRSLLNISNT